MKNKCNSAAALALLVASVAPSQVGCNRMKNDLEKGPNNTAVGTDHQTATKAHELLTDPKKAHAEAAGGDGPDPEKASRAMKRRIELYGDALEGLDIASTGRGERYSGQLKAERGEKQANDAVEYLSHIATVDAEAYSPHDVKALETFIQSRLGDIVTGSFGGPFGYVNIEEANAQVQANDGGDIVTITVECTVADHGSEVPFKGTVTFDLTKAGFVLGSLTVSDPHSDESNLQQNTESTAEHFSRVFGIDPDSLPKVETIEEKGSPAMKKRFELFKKRIDLMSERISREQALNSTIVDQEETTKELASLLDYDDGEYSPEDVEAFQQFVEQHIEDVLDLTEYATGIFDKHTLQNATYELSEDASTLTVTLEVTVDPPGDLNPMYNATVSYDLTKAGYVVGSLKVSGTKEKVPSYKLDTTGKSLSDAFGADSVK